MHNNPNAPCIGMGRFCVIDAFFAIQYNESKAGKKGERHDAFCDL